MPNNVTYDQADTIVCGEAQEYFNSLDEDISEAQFKVRQASLRLLMANFHQSSPAQAIYECAHDWSTKQSTTSGLASYFKAYYTGRGNNSKE